jgi:hypothetical protein
MSFSYARDEISSFVTAPPRPYVGRVKTRERKFKTKFWRDVAARLPLEVRNRHFADLERAERWELAFDRFIERWTRAKQGWKRVRDGLTHAFHAPRGAH